LCWNFHLSYGTLFQTVFANERNITVIAARLRRHSQAGLAVIACLLASMTNGQPAAAQAEPNIDCTKAMSTPELNWCSERELESADKKLNEAYKRSLAHIAAATTETKGQREKWISSFREAQRRWIAFRDHDCGEVISYEWSGGTGMTGAMLGCKISKTEARTKELEDRYSEN
jgi:uncharacterized protein YecT (DUF1311 family)